MPAVGKVTLDIRDYERMLAKAERSTAASAGKMSASMETVGTSVKKSTRIVSALSTTIGSQMGAAGGVISAIAAGPVALLIAAFGALAAAGMDMWDRLTTSADEYAAKQAKRAADADRERAAVEKEQTAARGYMDRLRELSRQEALGNAGKREAATLIGELSRRYGDLGLSVNDATGKIVGLAEAQTRLNELMKQERRAAIMRQIGAVSGQTTAAVQEYTEAAFGGMTGLAGFKKREKTAAMLSMMRSTPLQEQVRFFTAQRDAATTTGEIEAAQKVIDLLRKRLELREDLRRLEIDTAGKAKATNLEQPAVTAEKKLLDTMRERISLQRLILLGERDVAAEIQMMNDLKRQGVEIDGKTIDKMRELRQTLGGLNLKKAQQDQLAGLYEQALRASGQGEKADLYSAVRRAEAIKGGSLTGSKRESPEKTSGRAEETKGGSVSGGEMGTVEKILALTRELNSAPGLPRFGEPQTNSLTARGGFAGGVRDTRGDVAKQTLDYNKAQAATAEKILVLLNDLTRGV